MARVLVFGARGMLGSALARVMAGGRHSITALDRAAFDIAAGNWAGLPDLVAEYDYVLNAAGLITRRAVPAEIRWRVNAEFPHALSRACQSGRARLIQFSTDCVFDGVAGLYDENSPATASDDYGRGKRAGEPASAMTLRCSIVGPEHQWFYNLLCWSLRQQHIDGYVDHFWNGLTTLALSEAVLRIVDADLFTPGVRHLHADDTDKCTLVATICRAFGHAAHIRPLPAPARRDTRLRTRHPSLLAELRLPPIARQIEALVPCATPQGKWRTH